MEGYREISDLPNATSLHQGPSLKSLSFWFTQDELMDVCFINLHGGVACIQIVLQNKPSEALCSLTEGYTAQGKLFSPTLLLASLTFLVCVLICFA